jgi:predicted DNA-binding transcriptional regulator AlpA
MENTEPVAIPIKRVEPIYGFTRSETYRRLSAGDFKAVKNGKRTLVLVESIKAYLASLPTATFRPLST